MYAIIGGLGFRLIFLGQFGTVRYFSLGRASASASAFAFPQPRSFVQTNIHPPTTTTCCFQVYHGFFFFGVIIMGVLVSSYWRFPRAIGYRPSLAEGVIHSCLLAPALPRRGVAVRPVGRLRARHAGTRTRLLDERRRTRTGTRVHLRLHEVRSNHRQTGSTKSRRGGHERHQSGGRRTTRSSISRTGRRGDSIRRTPRRRSTRLATACIPSRSRRLLATSGSCTPSRRPFLRR